MKTQIKTKHIEI